MPATDAVLVLTTLPIDADAAALARTLVGERLAACVSMLPAIDSTYRWQDGVETAREHQLIIKTRAPLADRLLARLQALHPYEVPELLVVPVAGGSAPYLSWLAGSTSAEPDDGPAAG